jgi:hypothetical protein
MAADIPSEEQVSQWLTSLSNWGAGVTMTNADA